MGPKPHKVPRPCSTERACDTPPKWVTSGWSPCSKSCGYNGTRKRRVYCQVRTPEDYLQKVNDQECINKANTKKPNEVERCNYRRCEWRTGQWGTCSKSCGNGTRARLVSCLHQSCTVDGSFFCHGNTDYCYVKGYRDLCCKTCANY